MNALAMDKRMASLRLSKVLTDLHDTATDKSLGNEVRLDASRELAHTINRHFDLIVTGLRAAGGARKP